MTILHLAQQQLIDFVLIDSNGTEVPGLGTNFTVRISKNGADLVLGTGVKDEIGSGLYSYQLTAAETDTEGPLAIIITAIGAVQQNLVFEVSGSILVYPSGPNILSSAEAAEFLKCATDDPTMLLLLPQVDAYIKRGTGRNWAAEDPIPEEAKSVARGILVRWHEDPGMLNGSQEAVLSGSVQAGMAQLRAMAAYYFIFEGLPGLGLIPMPGVFEGDSVIKVTGKVGISGDQSAKFESVITWDGFLQQISGEDLEQTYLEAHVVPPGEMP